MSPERTVLAYIDHLVCLPLSLNALARVVTIGLAYAWEQKWRYDKVARAC